MQRERNGMTRTTLWSADTNKRERPQREVFWETLLHNRDIQVIYEEEQYYLGMWNEGAFEPITQVSADFDVRRFLVGFTRLEEEVGNTNPLCGLFHKEESDQSPLFQRGYRAAFLSYERFMQERDSFLTREWSRGNGAGYDDQWLRNGYVNTGRKYPSCMEPLDWVQWLL